MKKIIIGLAGEMASGKGAVSRYLIDKAHANSYRFSTVLGDILDRLYIDKSRENYQTLSFVLRDSFGEDVLAKVIYNDVKNDSGDFVIVDGVRRKEDVKSLRDLPEFRLIYIDTDMKIRYERTISRAEKEGDADKTYEQFVKEHEANSELEIKSLKEEADYVVNNDGDLKVLYDQLDKIIDKEINGG